ncbi:non-compact myelin associated protein [Phyllostomus discolor]|uniref:Non-compact myelin associated protein n=1 Tax=Phyllostomus discolor TaxID=89673 RepID=A0A834AFB4_9CHIR|nr:non-compact myelin associated protein [Phyllostomus discolor]
MTTAAPTGTTPFFSLNVTTKEEDALYKSSGAIVAGVVVVVVLLLTAVLYVLKRYNRKMRAKRELEPKGAKPASFAAQGPKRGGGKHSASVTFSPVDVQMKIR